MRAPSGAALVPGVGVTRLPFLSAVAVDPKPTEAAISWRAITNCLSSGLAEPAAASSFRGWAMTPGPAGSLSAGTSGPRESRGSAGGGLSPRWFLAMTHGASGRALMGSPLGGHGARLGRADASPLSQ